MSTVYNGDGTIPQATNPYNPIDIASVANAGGAIEIVTTPAHGFNDGDTITVEGCLRAEANGLWSIVVLGAHTFVLNGSTFVSTAGAGGIAIDYSVNPLITIPSDGDPRDVSSVNPALEESANIVPYLYKRVGQYNLYNAGRYGGSNAIAGNWQSQTITSGGGWTLITGTDTDSNTPYSPWLFNGTTDLLELTWNLSVDIPDAGGVSAIGIGIAVDGGSMSQVAGTLHRCGNGGSPGADIEGPLQLYGLITGTDLSISGQGHSLNIGIMGHASSTSIVFKLLNPWSLSIKHYRRNI